MSDPWSPEFGGLTVTVKYGKGYEESWVVFRGTIASVREDIIAYFGLDGASVTSLTLSELVVNVTSLAHGKGNIAATLGATVLGSAPTSEVEKNDPWANVGQSAPAAPAPTENPMLARIKAVTNVADLKLLWAENQAAFADVEVMAAWKARGKALQAAA